MKVNLPKARIEEWNGSYSSFTKKFNKNYIKKHVPERRKVTSYECNIPMDVKLAVAMLLTMTKDGQENILMYV